jgi:hypothetical protein
VRSVAASLHPDHATIAALRRASRAATEPAFLQVLLLARARPAQARHGGGGEEHRGVPVPRSSRLEGGGGRRPGAGGAGGALPRRAFPGREVRRGPRRGLRRGRRVRVSLAHRHLRTGDRRGARLRHAGCRLPGDGPEGRDRRSAGGRARP